MTSTNEAQYAPASPARRLALLGAVAGLAATATWPARAHHGVPGVVHGPAHEALAAAAAACVRTGDDCLAHCIGSLTMGDTMLAVCADRVMQMRASCDALASMAAYDSRHLPALARVCAEVCRDCESECRQHEAMHAICGVCADACATCIDECGKVSA
ncbi:MAG: four-helix bundle copper-binding protein [Gammaproteobacteria bacterium]|nr:four-helix bundle copper-binding protein [Gammaproteobacteria bacterium]